MVASQNSPLRRIGSTDFQISFNIVFPRTLARFHSLNVGTLDQRFLRELGMNVLMQQQCTNAFEKSLAHQSCLKTQPPVHVLSCSAV